MILSCAATAISSNTANSTGAHTKAEPTAPQSFTAAPISSAQISSAQISSTAAPISSRAVAASKANNCIASNTDGSSSTGECFLGKEHPASVDATMEEDANHDSNDDAGECFVGKEDGVDAATTMEEDANHEADSGVDKSEAFLPPQFPNEEDCNVEHRYEHSCLRFLETLRGAEDLLSAGERLLEEDESTLNGLQKSIRDGLLHLNEKKYTSQEDLSNAFEAWKEEFTAAVSNKYKGSLNFGDALNRYAVAFMIAHFAPNSCKEYKDTKEIYSMFCKIDRENPCMRMFDWILAKSLHKEAGGEWSEETKCAVSKRMSIVDAKILVTEDTDNHEAEFKAFCDDNGISMEEMNLIGLLLVGVHVRHHELGSSGTPLTVLVSSASTRDNLFSNCGYFASRQVRYLGYVAHGQVWATKTLKNHDLYPIDILNAFSARLVCFYRSIANDIAQSSLDPTSSFKVKPVSNIAERYAGVADMTPEELEDLKLNAAARSQAADIVRYWRSEGLVASSEDALELLLIYYPRLFANVWYGSVEGGETTGRYRTEAKDLLDRSDCDREDTQACFEYIKQHLSETHAIVWYGSVKGGSKGGEITGRYRTEAKDLLDRSDCDREDTQACFEYIKKHLSETHAIVWIGSVEGGEITGRYRTEAKDLIDSSDCDREDTKACFEHIKKHLSETHAIVWMASVEGGETTGRYRTEAKDLIDSSDCDREDTKACFEHIKKHLSETQAIVWMASVEGSETTNRYRTEAKDLIDSSDCDREDTQACFEYIEQHLSKTHAIVWRSTKKKSDASKKIRQCEDVDAQTRLLALQRALQLWRRRVNEASADLDKLPEHARGGESAVGHLYKCRVCLESTPFIRYNSNGMFKGSQYGTCSGLFCNRTGKFGLPKHERIGNKNWEYEKSLSVDELKNCMSEKENGFLSMIDALEKTDPVQKQKKTKAKKKTSSSYTPSQTRKRPAAAPSAAAPAPPGAAAPEAASGKKRRLAENYNGRDADQQHGGTTIESILEQARSIAKAYRAKKMFLQHFPDQTCR